MLGYYVDIYIDDLFTIEQNQEGFVSASKQSTLIHCYATQ